MSFSYTGNRTARFAVICLIIALANGAITEHFGKWLKASGLGSFDFNRSDLDGASFGGRNYDHEPIKHTPIIFVHGNSDKAYGDLGWQIGWKYPIQYLMMNGYTSAELYTTTWGPADILFADDQYHSREYLTRIRTFIEAVLNYTKAEKVNVVGHSMGVTLARKAIQGGVGEDILDGGFYDLGRSLKDRVDTFVGIAGANWGLVDCYTDFLIPTCATVNGFFPGIAPGPIQLSAILTDINYVGGPEAGFVFTIYSLTDEVIGYGDLVWGKFTSKIMTQNDEIRHTEVGWTHLAMRDNAGPPVLQMVTNHIVDGWQDLMRDYIINHHDNKITTWYGRERNPRVFDNIYDI
jgi:pimeloyl-ACP methyl ester carboxylesterase